MFRKLLPIHALAALIATALLPVPAQAQRTVKFYDAFAYFYDDPGGCEYFETYLDVFESWTRYERGRTEHTTRISFQSLHYDTCADVPISVVQGVAEIPANAFQSHGLKSASIQLAMDITDRVGGALVPVLFDLTWSCQEERPLYGGCGVVELSGNVLVESRNLMDSEYKIGELLSFKAR